MLYDEIDTVFGPRAKENEDIRGMLNSGHRKGAKAGRCVVRGNAVATEEFESYCAVALAGLDDLPDTIMSRSIVVRMRRRAPMKRSNRSALGSTKPTGHSLRERSPSGHRTIPDEAGPTCPMRSPTATPTSMRLYSRWPIRPVETGPSVPDVAL